MDTDAIIELLSYAHGQECSVRLVLTDGTEIVGVPESVDTHPTAYEAFIRPDGDDDTEIGISLTAIASAEMV